MRNVQISVSWRCPNLSNIDWLSATLHESPWYYFQDWSYSNKIVTRIQLFLNAYEYNIITFFFFNCAPPPPHKARQNCGRSSFINQRHFSTVNTHNPSHNTAVSVMYEVNLGGINFDVIKSCLFWYCTASISIKLVPFKSARFTR